MYRTLYKAVSRSTNLFKSHSTDSTLNVSVIGLVYTESRWWSDRGRHCSQCSCAALSGQQTDKANRQLNEHNNKSSNCSLQKNREGEAEQHTGSQEKRKESFYRKRAEMAFNLHLARLTLQVCVLPLCDNNSSSVCTDTLPCAAPSVPEVSYSTQTFPHFAHPLDSFSFNAIFIYYLHFCRACENISKSLARRLKVSSHHNAAHENTEHTEIWWLRFSEIYK